MKPQITIVMMLAAAVMLGTQVNAAPVDADAALNHAQSFMASRSGGKLMAPGATLRLTHTEVSSRETGEVDYYVFSTSDDGAFVIVAGEDRVRPILGCANGTFDSEKLPCNVRWWLDGYKRQMEWLRNHPEMQPAERIKRAAAENGQITVEPMLTCQWNQGEPYDWQCAVYEGEYCLTGCVATAMAQVMYYWKYPDELPALPAYTSSGLSIYHEALPSVKVDWENMLDNYRTNYTSEQGHAVAKLMRYCSQACYSDCSPGGTGSSPLDQLFSLKKFGYSRSANVVMRDDYSDSDDEWRAMVDGELLSHRPILYGGNDGSGGHAFVIDGYDNGLYHVNWGWGGYYDGYYELDLLDPYPGCSFMYRQDMVYHICPANGDEGDIPAIYDFEVDDIYYKLQGNEALVSSRDKAYNSYSGRVEVPATVTNGGVTYRVTGIDNMAFAGCVNLESVRLPYIESIGNYAFARCDGLREVALGKSLKYGGQYSFYSSLGIERVDIEDVEAWAKIDFETLPANPMSVAQHVYCNGEELTHLVLGGQVQSLKKYTFGCNKSLKSVTLEDGVKDIGNYAFYECPKLEQVTLPDGLRHIGNSAFCYCESLSDLEFKGSVGAIGEYAFFDCFFPGTLTFPSHVDTICYAAFCYSDINQLVVHDVDRIEDYAFYYNPDLEQVSIKGVVKSIGSGAFEECPGIKFVDVHDLSSWLQTKFDNSTANPLSVSHQLHVDGQAVTRLEVPAGVNSINDFAFVNCDSLTSVTAGAQVTSIGKSAFYGCANLEDVTLGDSVAIIGQQAFYSCSKMEHLTLGRGLQSLGARAFSRDNALRDITCRALFPPVMDAKDCFSPTVYNKATVTVPLLKLKAYKQADYWKQFLKLEGDILGVGDVNEDGEVNIADVNVVVGAILTDKHEAICDVNCDDEVNIADVNAIIMMVLFAE